MPSKYEALLTVVRVLNEQSERMERDEDAIKYEALLTVVRVLNEHQTEWRGMKMPCKE